jgi:hypothetical protein
LPRVSLWFFAVAPVYVLIGMSLGIFMGVSGNHSLYPAHAHMNLIGWVTMALFGTFYALARDASKKLAWTAFWLTNAGLIIMIPSLAMVLTYGEQPQYVLPLGISEFLMLAGMASFALSVWGVLRKSLRDDSRGAAIARPLAAE